jgi:hypothetical protein
MIDSVSGDLKRSSVSDSVSGHKKHKTHEKVAIESSN